MLMKNNSNGSNFGVKLLKLMGSIFAGFFIGCAVAVIYALIVQVVSANK